MTPTPFTLPPASPVNLQHAPGWLKVRMRQRLRLPPLANVHDAATFTADADGCYSWLDHWGSTRTEDGDVAFIAEPYGLRMETLRGALRFAEALGLNLRIEERSDWNPTGGTIRLVFTPS